ncbi:hypothetical protein NHF46_09830 [Arthrobacter alpinus]|nr:hypothetical protein [Arthrobacter alpinus]
MGLFPNSSIAEIAPGTQRLSGSDAAGAQRAMKAMMGKKKLIIAELQAADDS